MKHIIRKILNEELNGVDENIIKDYMTTNYGRLYKNYIEKYDVYIFYDKPFQKVLFWYHPWNKSLYLRQDFFNKLKDYLTKYELENRDIYKLFAKYFEDKNKVLVRTVDPTSMEKPILTKFDKKSLDIYEPIFNRKPKSKPNKLTNKSLNDDVLQSFPDDVIRTTMQNTDYGLTKFKVLVKPTTTTETMRGIEKLIHKIVKTTPIYYKTELIKNPEHLTFFSTDNKVFKTLKKEE